MAKSNKDQTTQQEEAEVTTPAENPQDASTTESKEGQDTTTAEGKDNKEETTPSGPPSKDPPASEGKKRLVCEAYKGMEITVSKGVIVKVGEDGTFEVGEKEVARLLKIPGYKEA
jgi:hypothetical protein